MHCASGQLLRIKQIVPLAAIYPLNAPPPARSPAPEMRRAQPSQARLCLSHAHRANFNAGLVDCPVCGMRRVVWCGVTCCSPWLRACQAAAGRKHLAVAHLLMMSPALPHHLRRRFQVELGERERHAVVQMLYRIALQITRHQRRQCCNVARNVPDGVLRRM